jgi:hypothetical protein
VSGGLTDGMEHALDVAEKANPGQNSYSVHGVQSYTTHDVGEINMSAKQTLVNDEYNVGVQGSGHLGSMDVSGAASFMAGGNITAEEKLKLDGTGLEASAGIAAFGGVSAAAAGQIGNQYFTGKGEASASVGVQGEAKASLSVNSDGVSAKVGAGAFVGAEADAKVSADVGGVEGGLGLHAYAGAGVHAQVEFEANASEIKIGIDLGAAIGVGVGIEPSITIHPDEIIKNLSDFGKSFFGW